MTDARDLSKPQPFPNVSDILKRKGIWLNKKKSQHFLKNQEVCQHIAELAELSGDDLAIEVGTGLGNLTVELGARAGRVVSVEMDEAFADWHHYLGSDYDNIVFKRADFLQENLEDLVSEHRLGGKIIGVGNLPYQITSEILFRFVDSPVLFDRLVFMVQKEVAERVCAGAGVRASGALTYKIALRYDAEIAFHVGPEFFLPPPKVDSSVMVLTPVANPLCDEDTRREVGLLLDRIFRFRRKTLLNGLIQAGFAQGREHSAAILEHACIDEIRRPETLTLPEALALNKAQRALRQETT